nr:STAS domain-containing protein [uncultured Blautia sp.]
MEDRIKKRGNLMIVYVPKELDHHFAGQMTERIDRELEKGLVKQLVFDFSETTFMDSSGIGMLMGRKRLLSYSGGTVSAIHVNDRILKIMQLSGIYKHIEISQEPVWNRRMP